MCIIDCSPTVLKILHSSPEFMPYVVFLSARIVGDGGPEDLNRGFGYSSRSISV